MEIYLEQQLVAGQTVEVPIALYNSVAPINQLFWEGARFRVGSRFREPEAAGKITRVMRSGGCEPGAPFQALLMACQRPTVEVMDEALASRGRLTQEQADHINYLACFTHYPEAVDLLSEFGIRHLDHPAAFHDTVRKTLHFKIVLNNPLRYVLGLHPVVIAENHGSHVFRNRSCSKRSDGTFSRRVSERSPDGKPLISPLETMTPAEIGVSVIVTSYRSERTEASGSRVVFHADAIPMNNVGTSLDRMFGNASAIIATPFWNRDYTLSYEWLEECPAIQESLARAFWLIIETENQGATIEFVERLGAEYRLTPFSVTRRDYLGEVEQILVESLKR